MLITVMKVILVSKGILIKLLMSLSVKCDYDNDDSVSSIVIIVVVVVVVII